MKFFVQHDPIRQRVNVYCELPTDPQDGNRRFVTRRNEEQYISPEIHVIGMGSEPPIWDWFPDQIVEALGNALAPRPDVTERHLEDALTVRDRLLAVLESEHLHGSGDPGTVHLQDEAELRREAARRAR